MPCSGLIWLILYIHCQHTGSWQGSLSATAFSQPSTVSNALSPMFLTKLRALLNRCGIYCAWERPQNTTDPHSLTIRTGILSLILSRKVLRRAALGRRVSTESILCADQRRCCIALYSKLCSIRITDGPLSATACMAAVPKRGFSPNFTLIVPSLLTRCL